MVGWFGLGVFWLVFLGLVCLFACFGFGLGFFLRNMSATETRNVFQE